MISPPPTAGEQFGVNTGVLFNSGKYTSAQIDQQVAALAQTGATVVRSDALWEKSEPQPPIGLLHRYDWSFDDRIVGALAAHGLQWLPIIDYSASWAHSVRAQGHSPPATVSDYASYAGAVAGRYGPRRSYWLEHPQRDAAAGRDLRDLERARQPRVLVSQPATRPATPTCTANANAAITSVEPGARVIIGGLTRPAWFLSAMLAADPGLRDQISGVGIHPYAANPGAVVANVRSARLAMRADGLGSVPMYVTEFRLGDAAAWRARRGRGERASGNIAQTFSILGRTDCDVGAVLGVRVGDAAAQPGEPPGLVRDLLARGGSEPRHGGVRVGAERRRGPRPAEPSRSSAAVPPPPAGSASAGPSAAERRHRTRARRVRSRPDRDRLGRRATG